MLPRKFEGFSDVDYMELYNSIDAIKFEQCYREIADRL